MSEREVSESLRDEFADELRALLLKYSRVYEAHELSFTRFASGVSAEMTFRMVRTLKPVQSKRCIVKTIKEAVKVAVESMED